MLRIALNFMIALDRITGLMIRPLLFMLLVDIVYLLSKGIELTYGCN